MRKAVWLLALSLLLTGCAAAGPVLPGTGLTTAPSQTEPSDIVSTPQTQPSATDPTVTEPPVTEPPATEPAVQTVAAFTVTQAPVYAKPSQEEPALQVLENRTDVALIQDDGQWAQILLNGGVGYIPSAMLRLYEEGKNGYTVVIDAGHQRYGDYNLSPLGPGSSEMKFNVSGGTQGRFTGIPEYELTLAVAEMLRDILEARGYTVVMVRTEHDVNISNIQRAEIANGLYADAFIRIHANGSDDAARCGAMTICQTPQNPYNARYYAESRALSEAVLEGICASSGCVREYVWETDTMSGINWCSVPVTIVEMGYMTNETEDRLLATQEYRQKMAEGMADGLDRYFGFAQP